MLRRLGRDVADRLTAARLLLAGRQSPPLPTTLSVIVDKVAHPVALRRRPGARRMTLRVSGVTGEIALTVPERAKLPGIDQFLQAHAGWIAVRLARLPDRIGFEPGAIVPLRGVPHRIQADGRSRGPVIVSAPENGAAMLSVAGDARVVPGRVRRFLQAEAERDLRSAVGRYTALTGTGARQVTLRDTRSRWGSCSSSGTLSFSWRLIMAPPHVLDYLAAHEVAHLQEMNHSARYWRLLRGMCPATDEAEAWLKRHGSELHRYG